MHTWLWDIIWWPVIIWKCFKLTKTLRNFMLNENLSIDSIGGNHELKPRNSRWMGPCYLVLPCWNIFVKTDQVFLHLFSFSTNTTWKMFDESVNTYRNNFRKKRKFYDNEKKEIKMSLPGLTKLSGFQINPKCSPISFFIIKTRELFKELTKIVNIYF